MKVSTLLSTVLFTAFAAAAPADPTNPLGVDPSKGDLVGQAEALHVWSQIPTYSSC